MHISSRYFWLHISKISFWFVGNMKEWKRFLIKIIVGVASSFTFSMLTIYTFRQPNLTQLRILLAKVHAATSSTFRIGFLMNISTMSYPEYQLINPFTSIVMIFLCFFVVQKFCYKNELVKEFYSVGRSKIRLHFL